MILQGKSGVKKKKKRKKETKGSTIGGQARWRREKQGPTNCTTTWDLLWRGSKFVCFDKSVTDKLQTIKEKLYWLVDLGVIVKNQAPVLLLHLSLSSDLGAYCACSAFSHEKVKQKSVGLIFSSQEKDWVTGDFFLPFHFITTRGEGRVLPL